MVSLLFSLCSESNLTLEFWPAVVTIATEAEVHTFTSENLWTTIRPKFAGNFRVLGYQIIL